MTSLPIAAGLRATTVLSSLAAPETSRQEGERFLVEAFRSFAEAADSLERSYGMLRSEVIRLNKELERSNEGLKQSLQENRKMRLHLDRIVNGLPCGVLVARADGAVSLINPEARRLLKACATAPQASGEAFESGFEC